MKTLFTDLFDLNMILIRLDFIPHEALKLLSELFWTLFLRIISNPEIFYLHTLVASQL